MDPELDRDDSMDLSGESPEHHLGAFISAVCDDPNMDKAAKRKKIMKALDLYDEPEGAETDMDMEEEEEDEEVDTKDPEDTRGTPAAQEPEKMMYGQRKGGELDEEEEEDMMAVRERKKARESLQRLSKHKDPKVRRLAEQLARALPQSRSPAARRQVPVTETLARHMDPAVRAMAKRLDVLEAEKIAVASVQRAIQECKAAGLPKRVMTRLFIEDLADCPDPRRRKAMIQERAHLASVNLPRSYGPNGIGGGPPRMSDADFAAMVNGAE